MREQKCLIVFDEHLMTFDYLYMYEWTIKCCCSFPNLVTCKPFVSDLASPESWCARADAKEPEKQLGDVHRHGASYACKQHQVLQWFPSVGETQK